LKEQNTNLKEASAATKTEAKEWRRRFRDFRHRHPNHSTTKEFQVATKDKKFSSDAAEEVLAKFILEQGVSLNEVKYRKVEEEKASSDSVYTMSYLDICIHYKLDPESPETDDKLSKWVKLGWLQRSKLPKKDSNKLEGSGYPEAAKFKYSISRQKSSKTKLSTEGSKFEAKTDLQQACYYSYSYYAYDHDYYYYRTIPTSVLLLLLFLLLLLLLLLLLRCLLLPLLLTLPLRYCCCYLLTGNGRKTQ